MSLPGSSSPFRLVRLAPEHPVRAFTCGTRPGAAAIDAYLHDDALIEQEAGLSTVWVAVDPTATDPQHVIVGFFTLSPVSVRVSAAVTTHYALPTVPYPIGGYLLGRLGVSVHHQGRRYGPALVAAAVKKARVLREEGGGMFLCVDPKHDALCAWYESLDFGFGRLDPRHRRLAMKR